MQALAAAICAVCDFRVGEVGFDSRESTLTLSSVVAAAAASAACSVSASISAYREEWGIRSAKPRTACARYLHACAAAHLSEVLALHRKELERILVTRAHTRHRGLVCNQRELRNGSSQIASGGSRHPHFKTLHARTSPSSVPGVFSVASTFGIPPAL